MDNIFLSVLLFLFLILSPATYYESELQQIHDDNQQAVSGVYADPVQLQAAQDLYLDDAQYVVVLDDLEGD